MSYTTSGISDTGIREVNDLIKITATSTHTDKVVQLYISGNFIDVQSQPGSVVEFYVTSLRNTDIVFLLAVDEADSAEDVFDEAFGISSDYGNRLRFEIPQLIATYLPDDVLKIETGDAGDVAADTTLYSENFYPGRERSCGFGMDFGDSFGWDGERAKGFGYNYGYGEYGFDCEMTIVESNTLFIGTYPYSLQTLDVLGNESTADTGTITLDTYARPASGLAVESYTLLTDALELSFTASPDIS